VTGGPTLTGAAVKKTLRVQSVSPSIFFCANLNKKNLSFEMKTCFFGRFVFTREKKV
jgi:hypothetical protein